MIYKTFQKVSNVCQLLNKSKYPATGTDRGITFTNNGDGSITIDGTPTGSYYSLYTIKVNIDSVISGHKYAILGAGEHLSILIIGNYAGGYVYSPNANSIYTLPKHEYTRIVLEIRVNLGYTYSNVIVKPQLFDLTEMYGAGNEPTTVEQFRQDFPEEMYDYSPYCFIKSYKTLLKASDVCQLLNKSKYPATTTKEGITWTNNGDGTITANGTATAFTNILVDTVTPTIIKSGHKFLILGCPLSNGNITTSKEYWMQEGYEFCSDHGVGGFFSLKGNNINLRVYIQKDYTADNLTFKPQIFDLTEMYGAGNEPTTVDQFKADFPEELYDYKPYSIVNSYKKSLVCKTKNLFDINSVSNLNNWVNKPTAERPYGYYQFNLKPNTTYTFQRNYESRNNEVFACFYEEYGVAGGQWFIHPTAPSLTRKQLSFTTNDTGIMYLNVYRVTVVLSSFIELIEGAQLELGDTATDYVPYGHL